MGYCEKKRYDILLYMKFICWLELQKTAGIIFC